MHHPRISTTLLATVLGACALLSACVVAPYPRRGVYSQPVPAPAYGYGYNESLYRHCKVLLETILR